MNTKEIINELSDFLQSKQINSRGKTYFGFLLSAIENNNINFNDSTAARANITRLELLDLEKYLQGIQSLINNLPKLNKEEINYLIDFISKFAIDLETPVNIINLVSASKLPNWFDIIKELFIRRFSFNSESIEQILTSLKEKYQALMNSFGNNNPSLKTSLKQMVIEALSSQWKLEASKFDIISLNSQRESLELLNAKFKKDIIELKTENDRNQLIISDLRTELHKKNQELTHQDEFQTRVIQELINSNISKEETCIKLEKLIQEKNEIHGNLLNQFDQKNLETIELNAKLQENSDFRNALEKRLSSKEGELIILQDRFNDLFKFFNSLKDKTSNIENKMIISESNLTSTKEEVKNLKSIELTARITITGLSNKNKTYKDLMESLQMQLNAKERALVDLRVKNELACSQVDDGVEALKAMSSRNTVLSQKNMELEECLTTLISKQKECNVATIKNSEINNVQLLWMKDRVDKIQKNNVMDIPAQESRNNININRAPLI